jgi:hypothetical protein
MNPFAPVPGTERTYGTSPDRYRMEERDSFLVFEVHNGITVCLAEVDFPFHIHRSVAVYPTIIQHDDRSKLYHLS